MTLPHGAGPYWGESGADRVWNFHRESCVLQDPYSCGTWFRHVCCLYPIPARCHTVNLIGSSGRPRVSSVTYFACFRARSPISCVTFRGYLLSRTKASPAPLSIMYAEAKERFERSGPSNTTCPDLLFVADMMESPDNKTQIPVPDDKTWRKSINSYHGRQW